MDKRSKYSGSVKEKTSSIIGESIQNGSNAFVAEFLKYSEENEVEPLPEFIIKTSSGLLRPRSSSKVKDEHGIVEKGGKYSPVFHLTFDNGRKWDCLKEIQSKDKEIPIPILDALNFAMEKYNTIGVLKLQNSQINAFGITIIAKMLVEIGCIRDLNLDMNPNVKENFYLLCSPAGNLMYLSLKLCEISDEGVKKIADELEYRNPPNTPRLLTLNLTNNRITEIGAGHIARMLRTNRSLQSLDLCGNRIRDEGASLIVHELSMSTLSHLEIMEKRRRRFAELILQEESGSKILYDDEGTINKVRKKSGLSQRSKKSLQRLSSASLKTNDYSLNSARSTYEKAGILLADIEQHPFKSETIPFEGSIFTCGNFQLQHLNFNFCGLTVKSLKTLIKCLYYQNYMMESDTSRGLLYASMEGNSLSETSGDWLKLSELLRLRSARKSTSIMEDYDELVPKEAVLLREAIRQSSIS